MGTTFENEILEIFGTTDLEQLKKISRDVASYNQKKQRNISGRKNSFTEIQAAEMVALYSQGESISDLARKYQVSRQTIYNQLKRAHRFSEDPDVKMRMNFMNHNYTEQILLRAFGVIENPDWKDFEYFLEDRCFPRTRDHANEILREMNLPFYDPLLIVEKTQGRMEGDHQWIMILKKEQ